jgi:hypothetical protein
VVERVKGIEPETDPLVLDFDHLGDKRFNISQALPDRNWAAILAEIEKCEVVCANCHRRRTARRGDFMRLFVASQKRIEATPQLIRDDSC